MLELKNISKQFGQHKIFDKYNLTVEEGKILAIVGPSGGGKTTLLRMLAGLETIDSGQIIYENEEIPLDQMPRKKPKACLTVQDLELTEMLILTLFLGDKNNGLLLRVP